MSDSKFGYLLEAEGQIDPSDIVAEVARGFNVYFADVIGDDRRQHIIRARKLAMAAVRELTDLSLPEIGRLFGKDHTTVMHHVESVKSDLRRSQSLALVIERLTQEEAS